MTRRLPVLALLSCWIAFEGTARPDAPAPYDRAADLARRTAEAQRTFGVKAPVTTVEDVFVVATPRGDLLGPLLTTQTALAAFFNKRFAKRPSQAISVYIFPSAAPYEAYCRSHYGGRCISSFGFYAFDERTIVINSGPGIGTLVHELVHPIQREDFPEAPDWFAEGLASLYECYALPQAGEIRGVTNWRLPRLIRAMRSSEERERARIDHLFGMQDEEFRGEREDLYYALARYLCQWLEKKGKLWDFYRAWRDGYADDPTGVRAFSSVVGVSPEQAHADWARWVRGL